MGVTSWRMRSPLNMGRDGFGDTFGFEDGFGEWYGSFTRSTTQAKNGSYSAYSDGATQEKLTRDFTVPTGTFEVAAWVYVDGTISSSNHHVNCFYDTAGGDWGGPHVAVRSNNALEYYDGAWNSTGYTVSSGTWVRVRTVVDVDEQLFDTFVDDGSGEQQVIDGGAFIPRASFTPGDARQQRYTGHADTGVYYDDMLKNLGVDDRLLDVPDCTLAYNRFARSAEVVLDDPDGTIAGEYPRPTPVELDVKRSIDSTYSRRFGGYVNNPKREQNTTTLELLSHDAWIRARDVYRSYSATTISSILNDLITDLTPLTWDASRVNVYDDQSIDAEWSGTPLDKVIGELASYSNDEIFGATDDMVFFFEQRDSNRAPRDFTAGEYFADEVEFEQDGSAELNEVTVYYGGNPASSAVVVEDAEAQKSLADELDADRPVVISTSKTFTEIGTETAARRKGREILSGSSEILTGELTTWEAFNVDPGDVTRVQVPEQSIDAEFRVAEISHSWGDDETTVKLAENSQGVVDALVELSDEVSRVEARAADNNATIVRFTTFDMPFNLQLQVDAYKRTVPADQLLFGAHKGGWGDTRAGGGLWGDQRGAREKLL